jgi:hypothetical protein
MHEGTRPNRSAKAPRPNQKLLTLKQWEIESGVPGSSTRDLILRGHLQAVRLPGSRRVWLRRVDCEALIEKSFERGV